MSEIHQIGTSTHQQSPFNASRDTLHEPRTLPRAFARNRPVSERGDVATCSGVPSAMYSLLHPPSGPRSIIQSADLITSRLCSTTTTVCPDHKLVQHGQKLLDIVDSGGLWSVRP